MKKVLALFLVLNLTACATATNYLDGTSKVISKVANRDTLDTVEALYGSTLAVALGYGDLCKRQVINKSCWNTINTLKPYEQKAYNALLVARDFTKKNPSIDNQSFLQTAKAAIQAWRDYQSQLGVK